MSRTKLADRVLPRYSKEEEIINMVSHIVGGAFGIWALVSCIYVSVKEGDIFSLISSIVYGLSMIFLYCMSSIYHGLNVSIAKKVFQIIDHCAVFILIAGTYTPILLCGVRKFSPVTSYVMLAAVWAVTALGIVLNSIDLKKFRVFSMICYILMGWCIMIRIRLLPQLLTFNGFMLLLIGGIVYTIGAVLYIVGKKHKWRHSIFHIACVIASLLHFFCIFFYVI